MPVAKSVTIKCRAVFSLQQSHYVHFEQQWEFYVITECDMMFSESLDETSLMAHHVEDQ